VRQHGGDMVVESSLSQGSRFCIRLPSHASADKAPEPSPGLHPAG
jgi:signal transduction histidine kinase